MGDKTGIEWTDATWNPVTGCSKISAGCKNCYAEKQALRLQRMGQANYKDGFKVTLQPHMLDIPKKWTRPRKVFVNSMSDLFHEDVPDEFILKVLDVIKACPQHTFQVLTKRSARLAEFSQSHQGALYKTNLWIGVSVENEAAKHRIDDLVKAKPYIRFLSCEPLIGPLEITAKDLFGIHWVIVGGESGPGHREIKPDWVRSIRDACKRGYVAFFFKQWGGVHAKANGAELDGREHKQFPEDIPF